MRKGKSIIGKDVFSLKDGAGRENRKAERSSPEQERQVAKQEHAVEEAQGDRERAAATVEATAESKTEVAYPVQSKAPISIAPDSSTKAPPAPRKENS